MAFTTYAFYTDSYYGDSISESSFPKYESRAESKLNYLTYGNITDDALTDYDTEIQMATCALADLIYKIEQATNNAGNAEYASVKSMSSGGQSITFGDSETVISNVLGDNEAQLKLMSDTIVEYLFDTNLMYAGV